MIYIHDAENQIQQFAGWIRMVFELEKPRGWAADGALIFCLASPMG